MTFDVGSLVLIAGFYGLAGYYIDSIGVYLKPSEQIIKVGTWGKTESGGPQNIWSFCWALICGLGFLVIVLICFGLYNCLGHGFGQNPLVSLWAWPFYLD